MIKKGVVVFDFDGVIINSLAIQRKAFYGSYNKIVGRGKPPFKEFLSHSGDSLVNILKKMRLPQEMLSIYVEISKKNIEHIQSHHGMKEMIIDLKEREIKCGLLTGKDRERTIQILHTIGLYEWFDVLVCSDDIDNPKPHAEGLEVCIASMDLTKEDVVMVGDARNDIICARNAGVKSIAVSWGDTSVQTLKRESPDYVVYDDNELQTIIDELLCLSDLIS